MHRKRKFNEISGNQSALHNRSVAISNHNQSLMINGAGAVDQGSKRNSAMTIFAEQFDKQLILEYHGAIPVRERPVHFKFGEELVDLSEFKISFFAQEQLRELYTDHSVLAGMAEVLTLQRQATTDDA